MPKNIGDGAHLTTPSDRMEAVVRAVGGPSEAARITGKTRTTIDNWRRRGSADLLDVLPLTEAAGVSLDWLVGMDPASGTGPFLVRDPGAKALVEIPPLRAEGDKSPRLSISLDWVSENLGAPPERLRVARLEDGGMSPMLKRGALVVVDAGPGQELGDLVLVEGPRLVARRHYVMPDGQVQLTADADPNWRFAKVPEEMPALYTIVWCGQSV